MGIFMGKNRKKIIWGAAYTAGLFLAFKYLFPLTAPFLIAFLIVYACHPWLNRVQKKTHIRKEILLAGLLVLFAALLFSALWGLISWGTAHAAEIGNGIEAAQEQVNLFLHDCCSFLEQKFGLSAAHMEKMIAERIDAMIENMRVEALPKAAQQSFEYCKKLVAAGAFLGVGFISSMLLCKDYEGILNRLEEYPAFDVAWNFVEKTVHMIGGYLKAQAAILCVISLISIAGLLLGKVGGAVILGLLAGLLDALPFIGTGIVLMPTAVWQLISGNYIGALAAVVSYVLSITARELMEPRLLGKQVGMYPVVMLFSVYAGVKVFGLSGIFLGPLFMVLLREGMEWIVERLQTSSP